MAVASSMLETIDAVFEGEAALADRKPSMGCGIKWKPGNEPTT